MSSRIRVSDIIYRQTVAQLKRLCDNKCECCGREDNHLIIDHDHDSFKIRGMICARCNSLIGYFENVDHINRPFHYRPTLRMISAYLYKTLHRKLIIEL